MLFPSAGLVLVGKQQKVPQEVLAENDRRAFGNLRQKNDL